MDGMGMGMGTTGSSASTKLLYGLKDDHLVLLESREGASCCETEFL